MSNIKVFYCCPFILNDHSIQTVNMNWTNTAQGYGKLSIGLHWLMLLLLLAVYALIELRGIYPQDSAPREAMKSWHFMLGLSVLALVSIRVFLRVVQTRPAITPPLPLWQSRLATLAQVLLYGLMIGMPLAGWFLLSAAGKPIPFFGLELPSLLAENKPLAKQIKYLHALAGELGYFLIGLHAVAALFHHYVKKDNTLTRMLPRR